MMEHSQCLLPKQRRPWGYPSPVLSAPGAVAQPLAKTERIVVIGGGGSSSDGAGASKITRDVVNTIAQVPVIVEALTGIDIVASLKNLPGVKTVDELRSEPPKPEAATIEETPAEEPAAKKKPAEEVSAEETPAEEPAAADEVSADDKPAGPWGGASSKTKKR